MDNYKKTFRTVLLFGCLDSWINDLLLHIGYLRSCICCCGNVTAGIYVILLPKFLKQKFNVKAQDMSSGPVLFIMHMCGNLSNHEQHSYFLNEVILLFLP
jgi:hypothetical protein